MTPLDMFLKKDDEKFQEYGIRTQSEEILLEEVKDILGGQSCYIPCFHMKQPLQKLERSYTTFIFYLAVNAISYALLVLYVLPFQSLSGGFWPITFLLGVQMTAFFMTSQRDPGFIQKSKRISFLKLNQFFK